MGRVNQSTNPSCAIDATTYEGTSAVSRVTGLSGPPRTTGAQITTTAGAFGGHFRCAAITDSSKGTTWSHIAYFRSSVARTFRIYQSLYNGTTFVSTHTGSIGDQSLAANTWTLVRFTVTTPAGAGNHTRKFIHVDYPSAGTAGTLQVSSVRTEMINDSTITYADGDTAGWAWDGPAGASTSGELDAPTSALFLPF